MTPPDWSPAQYDRYKTERSQPFFDLLSLVRPSAGMRVADLGCGTGELTRALHEKLGAAATVGVDASEAMLERSRAFEVPGLTFTRGDIATWAPPAPVDLVFSNAALQWVDGHEALLARLASWLAPGGQIAVQIPANDDHPSHTVAAEIASESPFRDALRGHVRVFPNLTLDGYAALLDRLGFENPHVRMQVYAHRLPAAEDVIEWVKGSLLTDYEKRMEPALYTQFLARYRERLLAQLGDTRPFLFPFKRILFHATR